MKRIFTLLVGFSILLIQKGYAQTCGPVSTTSGLTYTTRTVSDLNGFTNAFQPVTGTFPDGGPSKLSNPPYYYSTPTTTINFYYELSTTSGTSNIASSAVQVKYGAPFFALNYPICIDPNPLPINVTTTPTKFYFTLTISPALPANTEFLIELGLDVNGGNDIIATEFGIEVGAVLLPVNFKSISAKKSGKNAEVSWEVGDEINVDHYDIERSTNGRDFVKVGQVAATNSPVYNFIDNHPYSGVSFYRIKNVDIDGKSKYSVIARLNLNAIIALQAYPQPASSSLTVEHGNAVNGNLHLFTVGGQVVKTIKVSPDRNQTPVDISSLNKGLYMLRFDNGQGSIETIKIVKQ